MKVIADTDTGKITIDPERILNFCPVSLNKTEIEHDTDGESVTVVVNHNLEQIAAVIARC